MITVRPGRISFPNGWDFDVHEIRNGEVFYQRWPPGIEKQRMFDNLLRTPLYVFAMVVVAEDGEHSDAGL